MRFYVYRPALLCCALLASPTAHSQSAQEIFAKAEESWKGIRDYRCMMQSNNKLGQEKDLKKVDFAFKRNQQVRMEVLDGKNKGSVLARNDSGRIMRDLDKGRAFIVTRNGVPVGELTPIRRRRSVPAEILVDAMRGAAAIDLKHLRRDLDRVARQDWRPRG